MLAAIGNQTINEGATLTLTATATDADSPANTLTYSLVSPSLRGASINLSSGAFTWTPTEAQGRALTRLQRKSQDNGSPSLSDTQIVHGDSERGEHRARAGHDWQSGRSTKARR